MIAKSDAANLEMEMKNNKFRALKFLGYARYAVIGAIGGVAVYNTAILVWTAAPTQSVESIAMTVGAVAATAVAKALHVV